MKKLDKSLITRSLMAVLLMIFAALFTMPASAQTPPDQEYASVPADWGLVPAGLGVGDQFRLLFISSTKRDATSSEIADYNQFVQDRAAAGHRAIRRFSSHFRVLGCTADVDARDNTGTTYTQTDPGVPIYWLDGVLADSEYRDFYDGAWDEELDRKDEFGRASLDTSEVRNYPFTGCQPDGTEAFSNSVSLALGSGSTVRVGRPDVFSFSDGPIGSTFSASSSASRPFYGLSGVFQVNPSDAALSNLELREGSSPVAMVPEFASGTTDYTAAVVATVEEITIAPTTNDSNATYEVHDESGTALVDTDSAEDDFQVALAEGLNTFNVVVTAHDDTTTQTYTVAVTTDPTNVTIAPAAQSEVEGDSLSFLLRRSTDNGPRTVQLEVSEDGDFLSGTTSFGATFSTTPAEVSIEFPAGVLTLTLSLNTEDDYPDEADGSVTLTVLPDPTEIGYTVGTPHEATTSVLDNDVAPNLYVYQTPVTSTIIGDSGRTKWQRARPSSSYWFGRTMPARRPWTCRSVNLEISWPQPTPVG